MSVRFAPTEERDEVHIISVHGELKRKPEGVGAKENPSRVCPDHGYFREDNEYLIVVLERMQSQKVKCPPRIKGETDDEYGQRVNCVLKMRIAYYNAKNKGADKASLNRKYERICLITEEFRKFRQEQIDGTRSRKDKFVVNDVLKAAEECRRSEAVERKPE